MLDLLIDKIKIESITYNLLSNAFKFTPNGGEISFKVELKEKESVCELVVSDSGKGISEEDKIKVFDRFYQVAQAEAGKYVGTGIGLAFVKDLVELHHGEIKIEDRIPFGTTFRTILLTNNVKAENHNELDEVIINEGVTMTNTDGTEEQNEEEQNEDLPIILVIEDNEELNHYISETLKSIGQIISSKNGEEGLSQAFKIIPDLIVSDVMMPKVSGFELCKSLKSDIRTSHIPFIMLTAKSDELSHIYGVQLGADNYLLKPFSPGVLISYVKNLIQSRKRLKELFAQRLKTEPHKFNIEPHQIENTSSIEENFIHKVISFIEMNMAESELSIDDMANQFFMSRSTFYRKLKALTGMSISDFIRLIKLKKSAQLLATGKYSVNLAAFEAGFNDLKYYRKIFKTQFGINPSEYIKNQRDKNKGL